MKKLLIYINSMNALGGIERVISNLSNNLKSYYKVTILVKDRPFSAYLLDDAIKIETLDIKLNMNMNSRMQRIVCVSINILKSIYKLRKYFKSNTFDYIYVALPTNAMEVYLSKKGYRKRIVASEHASYYAYNKVYKMIKNWLYPKLEAISVPTTMDTNIYLKLGYKAFYIPHMLTFNQIYFNMMESKRIINIGRLTSDKQQLKLLRIWKTVFCMQPETQWKLQIIGSGEEKNVLENYIANNSISNVELIPHTKHIAQYYQNAELFVFTSKMEGFGMVLLEAMSFGVPCISFDCPSGPRDIIKDNKNGYLIECYDEQAFAKKICEYMNFTREQKQFLSKGALETVNNWDNQRIINQWKMLFERLELEE